MDWITNQKINDFSDAIDICIEIAFLAVDNDKTV